MTRILITGAAGFLGRRLLKTLIAAGQLAGRPISQIILADIQRPLTLVTDGIEVLTRQGDLSDATFVKSLADDGFDTLFHLASFLTLQAETAPNKAFQVNVGALRQLIDRASNKPKVIFTSSIAIHGGLLPDQVDDDQNPVPQTTYGTHKAINELLISDYSRLGRIDGRSLRLPIVLTRPGAPTSAVSDQVAGIIREPLNGVDVEAPLSAKTRVPIASAGCVVEALIHLHNLPADSLPPKRAINLPALSVTIAELTEAAVKHGADGKLTYKPNPKVQAVVDSWPQKFVSNHAASLGINADADLSAVVLDYLNNKDD